VKVPDPETGKVCIEGLFISNVDIVSLRQYDEYPMDDKVGAIAGVSEMGEGVKRWRGVGIGVWSLFSFYGEPT
jgi:hypothetical protein